MKEFLTVKELIEKLQTLPPDSIPIIEKWSKGHHYTFKSENFLSNEPYESPYLGNDDIDHNCLGKWDDITDEFEYKVKFYLIAGI